MDSERTQKQKDDSLIGRLRTKYHPINRDPQEAATRIESLLHEQALVAEKYQDLVDEITGALNVPPGSDLVFCAKDLREDLYQAQDEIQRLRKEFGQV